MKRILSLIFACAILFASSQNTTYRYNKVPGNQGAYNIPSKEIQTPAYAASLAITTTKEVTKVKINITGALTLTSVITNCYPTDELTIVFKSDGSSHIVTFSTNFSANGTLTVPASGSAVAHFFFSGAVWTEASRETAPFSTVTTNTLVSTLVATDSITNNLPGVDITLLVPTIQQGTVTTLTTAATNLTTYTVTTSAVTGGVMTVAGTGTLTATLPTATALGTALGATAGTTFDFTIISATGTGGTFTLVVNTGITASGFPSSNTLTLASSTTVGIARFRLTFISATVATLTRTS